MTDALAHRGPDGRGTHIDGYVGLGHRRLSIIDLSEKASQPMKIGRSEFVISYNGEVYNFRGIRKRLLKQGIKFNSHSDTEVILKSFAKWGVKALEKYNGMFAFAFWDKNSETLTLARDRYGIKPLYYWQDNDIFMFASEIKAFLQHPRFKAILDKESLLEYFTFQNTFTYKTLFKGVKILRPGHYLQINIKNKCGIELKQYWDFHFQEEKNAGSEEEYLEECDRLFKQAVKRQLVSDVEVGSFLSGGIDTGSIVAIASQMFKDLKTFCVGFDLSSISGLERAFDERARAEHVSYLYQTEHYEMVLKSGDMQRCLPALVWSLEDLRLGQSYPNFYASKLASRFTKVCLSGGGGDELFAGYPWRYYHSLANKSFDQFVSDYYIYWQRLIPNTTIKKIFSPIWKDVNHIWTENIFKDVLSQHRFLSKKPQDYINHSLYFEAKTFLHGLFIVEDKLSMAHGLETRVPLLDNDLVDFALKIPVRMKLKNIDNILRLDESEIAKRQLYLGKTNDGKIILRKVLRQYVGEEIAAGHKQGFSGPDASWFKGESIDYVKKMLLKKNANVYDYLNYAQTKRIINEHLTGKQNRRLFIWSLLCFEHWLQHFIK